MSSFAQAMKWLREGEMVRRPCWQEGSYWFLDLDEVICWRGIEDGSGRRAHVHLKQLQAKDWEICEKIKTELEWLEDYLKTIKKARKTRAGLQIFQYPVEERIKQLKNG